MGIGPLRDAQAKLAQETTPYSKASDAESGILAQLNDSPDVIPFSHLRDLKTSLTDAMRAARSAGQMGEHRRLGILLGGVNDTMSNLVHSTDLPGLTGSAAGAAGSAATADADAAANGWRRMRSDEPLQQGQEVATGADGTQWVRIDRAAPAAADGAAGVGADPANANTSDANPAPGVGSAVFTPSGRRVDVRYGVREAGDVTASQMPDGRPNPAYPQELQPRDRTRVASQQQINEIANKLFLKRLGRLLPQQRVRRLLAPMAWWKAAMAGPCD